MGEHVRQGRGNRSLITPIGIAGCGRMGKPMLAALLHHGFNARGFDIRPAQDFGALADCMAPNIDAFGSGLVTAITVVRDVEQTEDLLLRDQNLIAAAPDLQNLIISSTLSPRYLSYLRGRIPQDITVIDAPMSGAQIAAQERRLSFMIGSSTEDLATMRPAFEAMGAHLHHMGEFGSGMQAKVLNNLLAASNTVMTRLVLDWADVAGLDEAKMLDLISTSSGQNWLASGFETIEFARDGYSPDNSLGILKKDIESALDAAPPEADQRLPELLADMVLKLSGRAV